MILARAWTRLLFPAKNQRKSFVRPLCSPGIALFRRFPRLSRTHANMKHGNTYTDKTLVCFRWSLEKREQKLGSVRELKLDLDLGSECRLLAISGHGFYAVHLRAGGWSSKAAINVVGAALSSRDHSSTFTRGSWFRTSSCRTTDYVYERRETTGDIAVSDNEKSCNAPSEERHERVTRNVKKRKRNIKSRTRGIKCPPPDTNGTWR